MTEANSHFSIDPVGTFASSTSRWVHQVTVQRNYTSAGGAHSHR